MSLKSSARALKASHRVSRRTFDARFDVPVCGIDEAGRGPLAGPVVTACVHIPEEHAKHPVWRDVADSKKLSPQRREYLYEMIIQRCVYAIAEASVEEIDTLNIHHATLLAMKRAYENCYRISPSPSPLARGAALSQGERVIEPQAKSGEGHLALVDGKFTPILPCPAQAIVKGDDLSLSIAAASILAKVTRDRQMAKLHEEFPHYGWINNAGYGTPDHLDCIARHGITIHHRKSFAPCKPQDIEPILKSEDVRVSF